MIDHEIFLNTMRMIMGTSSAITNHKNIIIRNRLKIYILEMEDVLFHLNSSVLMPENPEGKSSNDAGGGSEQQETVSGIGALALVFKQFEFDPDKRMLIAGHTDTSGTPENNFTLSQERAENVLYLLTGQKDPWASNCANRHRVEDYQQIMAFFAEKKGILCDPVKIDNKWGPDTEKATSAFLSATVPGQAETILKAIKNDPNKMWPEEAWKAVYDLYDEHLRKTLGITDSDDMKSLRKSLKFISALKTHVSCGESFPIDSKEKSNYKSQKNRRVEILFFDKDEIAGETFTCPAPRDTVHTVEECPLWKKLYFLPLYIDPLDLKSVVYHFKFVYWDNVAKKLQPVPEGLPIKAFYNNNIEIPVVINYKKGVYFVKVQYGDLLDDPAVKTVFFQFEGTGILGLRRKWIYTENSGATPVMVEKFEDEVLSLPLNERMRYYDLPEFWKSLNALVRYEGSAGAVTDNDILSGSDKMKVSKWLFTSYGTDKKPKFKPFSEEITSSDKPLVFCLDDTVLAQVDTAGTPVTYIPTPDAGTVGALLDNKLNVIDPRSGSPDYSPYYTKDFDKYLIVDSGCFFPFRKYNDNPPGIILYDRKLFDRAYHRIGKDDPRAGNRAAVYRLPQKNIVLPGYRQKHYRSSIGNFDAYLIRDHEFTESPDKETLSYIFCYFRWHFRDADSPESGWTPVFTLTPEWVETCVTEILKVWNNNDNLVELVHTEDGNNHRIRYHMEALDTIKQSLINSGAIHTIIDVHSNKIKDSAGNEKDVPRFRSNMSRNHGHLKENENKPFSAHGRTNFVGAHEFGHATSLEDDYHELWKNCSYGFPGFPDFVPGSPYRYDRTAMMNSNDTVRARYYWHFAAWLHNEFTAGDTTSFYVRRGSDAYDIGFNAANAWSSQNYKTAQSLNYLNTPVKNALYGTQNSKSADAGRTQCGNFDLFLYRIGQDPYSDNINGHSYLNGKRFKGLLIVKVNMYVEFWNDVEYSEINDFLNAAYFGIQDRFRLKNGLKITTSDPYLKDVFIQFSPRFLVKNYVREYTTQILDKEIKDDADAQKQKEAYEKHRDNIKNEITTKPHFTIKVKDKFLGDDVWDSSTSPSRVLSIRKRKSDKLWKFFSEMIGLPNGETPTRHNFAVGTYVPGGTIEQA